jgi:NAD(P)-dependent dehydrogenase (short-subunit alcohol dehydrogenase family)
MPSLENKCALVTGGGRGLGAAICRELARGGASVVVADRDAAGARSVAESIQSGGGRASAVKLDVTQEQWDAVIDVNLRGPFVMSKLVARAMKQQGGGQIVNIASTASKRAWANASAYHASKWGLLGLSHALHAELRPQRIKVSAIVAGGMRTPFLLDRFPDIDPGVLQDPANVAATVRFLLTLPDETVIPEVMVIPMRESSWP